DWYNRTGFIDQSQARATRQAPSIRVYRTGHAAHYILLLSRVLLWLTAFLSRMPLDRRETRDWLRPARSNMSVRLYIANGRFVPMV
uniref:Transposase n=1 Tax=Mesocestoides corti TaxID=53468 RepID=A0A5K3G0M8_MESCO